MITQLVTGGSVSSPIVLTTAAGSPAIQSKLNAADANPAWQILGSGEIDFGPGGASAVDSAISRTTSLPAIGGTGILVSGPGGANGISFGSKERIGAGNSSAGTFATIQAAGILEASNTGSGLTVKEGSNAKQGTISAMTAGAITVANTSVTASSRIFVMRGPGGTNPGAWYVSAQTAGTSFAVTSTNAADTGTGWFIIFEPGA